MTEGRVWAHSTLSSRTHLVQGVRYRRPMALCGKVLAADWYVVTGPPRACAECTRINQETSC